MKLEALHRLARSGGADAIVDYPGARGDERVRADDLNTQKSIKMASKFKKRMNLSVEDRWACAARLRGTFVNSPARSVVHRGYDDMNFKFSAESVATPWRLRDASGDNDEVQMRIAEEETMSTERPSKDVDARPGPANNSPAVSEEDANAPQRRVQTKKVDVVFMGTGRELLLQAGPPRLGVTLGIDKHRLRDAKCRWLDVPGLTQDFHGINAACVALKTLRDGPPPSHRRETRWTMNAWQQLSWNGKILKQVRGGFNAN